MAVYKVTRTHEDGSLLHIQGQAYTAVPATNNTAGMPWRDAVADYRSYQTTRRGTIAPPAGVSLADLESGAVHEWKWDLDVPAASTPAQVVAAIEAYLTTEETLESARLVEIFRYWGFTGDTG